MTKCFQSAAALLLLLAGTSCVNVEPTPYRPRPRSTTTGEKPPQTDADWVTVGYMNWDGIEYWDLNNDDRVDLEVHNTGIHDGGLARWYRIDNDYDGFCDNETRLYEYLAYGHIGERCIHSPVSPIRKLNKVRLSPQRLQALRE
jgi:hypothetical protein